MDLTSRAGRLEQGRRIQQAADDMGLSLEELAREIGCSRALIYQYVSGGVPAQPARLQKIARRAGRPLTFFYEDPASELDSSGGPQDSHGGLQEEPPERVTEDLAARSPGDQETAFSSRPCETEPARTPAARATAGESEELVARIALPYLEELADTQEAFGDTRGLVAACERIVPFARELHNRESEARAWLRIGNARIQRGHHDMAIPALQLALSLFERLGNSRLALSCHQSMGNSKLSLGDLDGARGEFQLVADGPAWMNRWQGTVSLAAVFEQQGDYRLALEQCEAALEIVNSSTREPTAVVEAARCYVLSNQANVYLACGDFPHAVQLSRELGRMAERVNQRDQFTESLLNLGICHIYSGEWAAAQEEIARAMDLARFSDDRPRWGFAQAWRASLLCLLGSPDEAKKEAKDALRIGVETADRRCEVQAHLALAEAYLQSSAPQEALYHADQAVHGGATALDRSQEMLARLRRSAALVAVGQADAALAEIGRVLQSSTAHGLRHLEALAREMKSRLHAASGEISVLDCEAESFLDDPIGCRLFKEQVARLRHAGRGREAAGLLEDARWPPLIAALELLPQPVQSGDAGHV
ncbi:MAG: helix-turn-helix domain-containing protein [Chloroflexi bacterium]|nr:helix-turn-helix domain-containing protein [Chloroflexota bacterium]